MLGRATLRLERGPCKMGHLSDPRASNRAQARGQAIPRRWQVESGGGGHGGYSLTSHCELLSTGLSAGQIFPLGGP